MRRGMQHTAAVERQRWNEVEDGKREADVAQPGGDPVDGARDASLQICKTICFVDADWSLFARPIEMEGVHVLWPRALCKLIRTEGSLTRDEIARIEHKLALALPQPDS